MTSQQAEARIRETQLALAGVGTTTDYGRASAHAFGPCPSCHIHVCLSNHAHTATVAR
jgi:hypothetical protein